ncbi:MAG: D-threitol dehydrogenase [Alphaproteobacteria bacterium]|nr:D-threitol dehydrogenase [Alphaproteobacteria bacterium]
MTNIFDFCLDGKTALITGGASGIGAAIADAFDQKGVKIAIVDLNLDAAIDKAETLDNAQAYACNVADAENVGIMTQQVMQDFGHIDILVNCAGIVDLAPAETISLTAWQRTIDINLTGSFLVCQAIGRHMIEAKSGKIINLASQAGRVAIEEHIAYCASKFAIIGMTKTLALEWGKYGITANSISPTVVMTELGKKAWSGEKAENMKALIPVGRFAEPDEIAAAAVFLASSSADMINGTDLLIDGGFTTK